FSKRGSITKIHFNRLDPDASPRHLRLHSKRNSFIRLYPDYKHILRAVTHPPLIAIEQDTGRIFEMDADLCASFRQPFTYTDVKWHVGPSPVIDQDSESNVGFRHRFGFYV